MLHELLILFFSGIVLCLIAYFIKEIKWLRRTLFILGGLLIASPFFLLLYLLLPIF